MVLNHGPFTFTAQNDKIELPAPESPAELEIQIIGAGTLTIELQDSLDGGTTYVAVGVWNASTQAAATNMTAAGIYRAGGGGQAGTLFRRPRLICTAFTSGTLVARIASVLRP